MIIMCRMLVAAGKVSLKPLLEGAMLMALDQVRIHEYNQEKGLGTWQHKDGWGMAYLDDKKEWKIYTSIKPIFEDHDIKLFEGIDTTLAIIHVRRSSVGEVRIENTHPFRCQFERENFIFCHNGTIKKEITFLNSFIPHGTTDSEKLFYKLLPALHSNNPKTEITLILQDLQEYTGLNFFLSSPTSSIINIQAQKAPLFYQMYMLQQERAMIVSSDPFPTLSIQSWKPIPTGNIFLLNHTTLGLTSYEEQFTPLSTLSPPKSS